MEHEDIDIDERRHFSLLDSIKENRKGLSVICAGFICNFMVFGITFTFGVFQEYYTSNKGPLRSEPDFKVAFIGSLAACLSYLLGIFSKPAMSILQPRKLMLIGGIVMTVGLTIASFCSETYQFILSQGVIFGVGCSFLYLPPIICAPAFFGTHRAIAMGFLFSGTGFGGFAMGPFTRLLIKQVGWKWCLRILGLVNLCMSIPASLLVSVPENMRFERDKRIIRLSHLQSWKSILFIMAGLLQSAGYLIPLNYMSKYARTLNFSVGQGSIFIGVNNAVNAIFKIILGFIGDKWGRMNTIMVCSIISAVTVFTLWYEGTRGTFISFVIFYGVFSGVIISLLPTCLVELFGIANYQAMTGLMYFSRGIGTILGSPLAGLMISRKGMLSGDFRVPIIYNGILLLASAVCLSILRVIITAERESVSWKF